MASVNPEREGNMKTVSSRRPLVHRHEATYRYSFVLGLLMVTFFVAGALPNVQALPLIMSITLAATLLVVLAASGAHHVYFLLAWGAGALGVAGGVVQLFTTNLWADTTTAVLTGLLLIVGPVVIIRGVLRERQLNVQTVLAALSLYIMLGLLFALVFHVVQDLGNVAFFTDHRRGTASTFLYFSFATMTTVGYGDFTAAANLGRTLGVLEAILGQLYLVTVVALLVGNLGAIRMNPTTPKDQDVSEGE